MAELIKFLIESTLWLGLFLLVYQVFLRRIRWPVFNRFFLLSGLLLSMILPLLHLDIWQVGPQPFIINLGEAVENVSSNAWPINASNVAVSSEKSWSWPLVIYFIFSGMLFLIFLFSLRKIYMLNKAPNRTPEELLAFSYFNFIYLHPKLKDQEHLELILTHEKAHARQWHSLDILLLHLCRIICWANPVLWFYHRPMRENHEYLADQQVLLRHPGQAVVYQQLILSVQLNRLQPSLVNNFNILSYKKRIAMINSKHITRRGKMSVALSISLFALTLFTCKGLVDSVEPDQVYLMRDVDKMVLSTNPRSFYENLQRGLKYPAEARKNEVSGKYWISFTITQEGQVTDVVVNRQKMLDENLAELVVVGYGKQKIKNVPKLGLKDMETDQSPVIPEEKLDKASGERALEQSLIETFQSLSPLNPATKDSRPVKIRLEVPITFKLG